MWAAKVNRILHECTFHSYEQKLKAKMGMQLATKTSSQRPWNTAQLQADINFLLKKHAWRTSCIILQAKENTDSLSQYLLNLLGQIQLLFKTGKTFRAKRGPGHESHRQQPLVPSPFSSWEPDHWLPSQGGFSFSLKDFGQLALHIQYLVDLCH